MPMPNNGESESAFVDRCVADPEAMRTAPDANQRAAMCHGMYREHQRMMQNGQMQPQKGGMK